MNRYGARLRIDPDPNTLNTTVPPVPGTESLLGTHIALRTLSADMFETGLTPIEIVSSLPPLPDPNYPQGSVVFLTTDNKLYRSTGTTWTSAVPAVDITGQITSGQIADNAIVTSKINDAAVNTNKLLADAVTIDKIAAHAVGLEQLFVGSYDNLIIDPGFEQGTTIPSSGAGWQQTNYNNGGGTFAIVTSNVRSGTNALQFNPSGQVSGTNFGANGQNALANFHVAATEGDQFYFEFYARKVGAGTPPTVNATISFRDKSGNNLASTGGTPTAPTTTYTKFSFEATAPTNTAFVEFIVTFNFVGGATELVNVDDAYARRMVTGSIIVDGTITAIEIAAATITGSKIAAGTITASNIQALTITANELAADSVTTNKIQAGAVTAAKIAVTQLDAISANLGVITAGLARDTNNKFTVDFTNALLTVVDNQGAPVTRVKLGKVGGTTTDYGLQIWNSAGTLLYDLTGLASNTVGTPQIIDGNVTTVKIGDSQVTTQKINDLAVTTAKIGNQAVTTTQLADGTITQVKMSSGLFVPVIVGTLPSLPSASYPQGAVVILTTDNKLYRSTGTAWTAVVPTTDLTGQIASAQIADNAVITTKINDTAVTTAKLLDDAVTVAKIAADAIGVKQLFVGSFDNLVINPGFEQSASLATPWGSAIQGGGTWAVVSTNARSGANAYQYNPSGQSALAQNWANGSRVVTEQWAATEGDKFYFEAYARKVGAGTANRAAVMVHYRSATNTDLGGTQSSFLTLTTSYQKMSVSATAPASTAYVEFILRVENGGNAELINFDDAYARRMVTGSIVVDGEITAAKIAAGTITSNEIAALTILAGNIAAGAITTSKISAGAVTATEIAADTITAGNIAAGAIGASELAAGAVVAGKIAAGTIVAADIAAATITADRLNVTTLSSITADVGTLNAGKIQNAGATAGILLSGSLPGGWTTYLNLVATGANPLLHHSKLDLKADGSAVFSGAININDVVTSGVTGISEQLLIQVTPTAAGINWTAVQADIGVINSASGSINELTLLNLGAGNINDSVVSRTGIWIKTPAIDTSGSIQNVYGIKIENQSGGSVSNYAIYTGAGKISFGDTLLFNVASAKILCGSTSLSIRDSLDSSDNLVIAGGGNVTLSRGNLIFGAAAGKVIPGATSLTFRNNADSNDNLAIADGGNITISRGNLIFGAAASKIIPGATSITLRNNADSQNNLVITDAGDVTISRGKLFIGASTSTLVPGATSFVVRNNADTQTNLTVADGGNVTARGTLFASGGGVGLTGLSSVASTSTGVGTIKMNDSTSRDSVGFIEVVISGVSYYIPIWDAVGPV